MLKRFARSAAYRSGVFRWVQRLNEDGARILMYHRFPKAFEENFGAQCEFLAANYDVVPLGEIVERLAQGRSLKNVACLTIDDGYLDVYEVAFPMLRRHGLPATLFVTTGFVEKSCWMPGDHVRYFCTHAGMGELTIPDERGIAQHFQAGDRGAGDRLRTLLKRIPNHVRTEVLATMSAREQAQGVGEVPGEYAPCSWEQLREMARGGISMGAHTVTHPILSKLKSEAETEHELAASQTRLEQELGVGIETFAYPNGGLEDIDRTSVDAARRHFRGAVTAVYGFNDATVDVHQLLRLPCDPDLPVSSLARMMAGPLRRRARTDSTMRPRY